MKSGIYCIFSVSNPSRFYIGSSRNVEKRLKYHFWQLSRNIHKNKFLQNHFNSHGHEDFTSFVVIYCPLDMLQKTERCFITCFLPPFNFKLPGNVVKNYFWSDSRKIKHSHFMKRQKNVSPQEKLRGKFISKVI